MESKNVKVIDEHGIDREANVVCSIDLDGSDYVIYWIERDNENDNLFVSKLIKNNDMTSNMVNIEDQMEKGKLSDVVKELITYAINNQNTPITNNEVTLASGKTIKVSSVKFNKEQNINVQKTYITTVKKSVTQVSEGFYKVAPSVETNGEVLAEPFLEPAVPPVVEPVVEPIPEPVADMAMPEIEPVSEPQVQSEVKLEEPVIEPISVTPTTIPEPVPVVPSIETIPEVNPAANIMTPQEPVVNQVEVPAEPVVSVTPEPVVAPVAAPVEPVAPAIPEPVVAASQPEPLVFDGSKESNLSDAFAGSETANNVSTEGVEALREFGQDAVTPQQPVSMPQDVAPMNAPMAAPSNARMGFANNKFLMVIAVVFFVGSCVFLGYEVFKYMQIIGQ